MIVDLSHHNSDSSPITAAQLAGCEAVWAKATEGGSYRDRQYRNHMAAALAAGVPFGAYHFARPGVPVSEQLANFTAVVQVHGFGQLPPMLDVEAPETVGDYSAEVLQLAQGLERITGRRPLIYSYAPWIRQHIGAKAGAQLAPYPLWLAAYPHAYKVDPDPRTLPSPPAPWPWNREGWTLWQYTSKGRLPGHPGNVDKNTPASAQALAEIIGDEPMAHSDEILAELRSLRSEVHEVRKAVLIDLDEQRDDAHDATTQHGSLRGWLAAIAEKVGATRERAVELDPTHKAK